MMYMTGARCFNIILIFTYRYIYFKSLLIVCISAIQAKEKPPLNVVGDVGGRIAIIVVCRVLVTWLFLNCLRLYLLFVCTNLF